MKLPRLASYFLQNTIVVLVLAIIGSVWFEKLSEASLIQPPLAFAEGSQPEDPFVNHVVHGLQVAPDVDWLTIGAPELGQLEVRDGAANRHVRFAKDEQGHWTVANAALNKGLYLSYSDGVGYESSTVFLQEGDRVGLGSPIAGNASITVAALDKSHIDLRVGQGNNTVHYRISTDGRAAAFEDIGGPGSVPWGTGCAQGVGVGGINGLINRMAGPLIARFKSDGAVAVARIGGTITCRMGNELAIALDGAPFDAVRIVYYHKRGFALRPGRDGQPLIQRTKDGIIEPLHEFAHPFEVTTFLGLSDAKVATLDAIVVGRTRYAVVMPSNDSDEGFRLKTVSNAHRVGGPCQLVDGFDAKGGRFQQSSLTFDVEEPFRRLCKHVGLKAAGSMWVDDIQRFSNIEGYAPLGLFVLVYCILIWFLRSRMFKRSIKLFDSGDLMLPVKIAAFVSASLPMALWAVSRIFSIDLPTPFQMDPALALVTLSNPVPTGISWSIVAISICLLPSTSAVLRGLLLAVTALLAISNYSFGLMGFSSPQMRDARFYEDSLRAIQLGSVALAAACLVPLPLYRNTLVKLSATGDASVARLRRALSNPERWLLFPGMLLMRFPQLALARSIGFIAACSLVGLAVGAIWGLGAAKSAIIAAIGALILLLIDVWVSRTFVLGSELTHGRITDRRGMPIGLLRRYGYLIMSPLLALLKLVGVATPWIASDRQVGSNRTMLGTVALTIVEYVRDNTWNAILFMLLFVVLASWFVFGVEEGISGVFQPSEVLKALTAFLLAVMLASVQQRRLETGIAFWVNGKFYIQFGLLMGLLATVFAVPVVKSDHSPLLILMLLIGAGFAVAYIVHAAFLAANSLRETLLFGKPLQTVKDNASHSLVDWLRRYVKTPWRRVALYPYIGIAFIGFLGLLAFVNYNKVLAEPDRYAVHFEERMTGVLRTPYLRARSWVELLPERLRSVSVDEIDDGLVDIAYVDTGRQVIMSRQVISRSDCRGFQVLREFEADTTAFFNNSIIRSVELGLRYVANQTADVLQSITQPVCTNNRSLDPVLARGIAMSLPAINNDFVTAWLFVATGRDGVFGIFSLQAIIVLAMFVIAFRAATRTGANREITFSNVIAGYTVFGFMLLLLLHWSLSMLFAIGRLPVMGQPSTFMSAGISHFLSIGIASLLAAFVCDQLRNTEQRPLSFRLHALPKRRRLTH